MFDQGVPWLNDLWITNRNELGKGIYKLKDIVVNTNYLIRHPHTADDIGGGLWIFPLCYIYYFFVNAKF